MPKFVQNTAVLFFLFLFVLPINGQEEIPLYSMTEKPFRLDENPPATILLKKALADLQEDFGVSFMYDSELIDDQRIPSTRYRRKNKIENCLKHLLKDTGLEFVKVAEATYVILRIKETGKLSGRVLEKDRHVLIGATIKVAGASYGTVSDLDGKFDLELPAGPNKLEISYVGFQPITKSVLITPGKSAELDIELKGISSLEEIIVLGARFQESSLLKKMESADVISQEKLSTPAQLETAQLLQYRVPSFHSTSQMISDGTDHIDPATLRGLGPDQMLVLINGKRRHHSALVNINGTIGRGSVATDLNAIPTAAIQSIEILKDGATTEYGSDAIAGVLNLVLKDNVNYTDINAMSGLSQRGDGAIFQFNGNHGLTLGKNGGFLNMTLDFSKRNAFNRSGDYTGKIFGDSRDEDPKALEDFFSSTGYSGKKVMAIGNSAATNASFWVNAEVPISPSKSFYAFGGTNYRFGEASGFFRFPYQQSRQSGIYPMGFSPSLATNIFDKSATLGIKIKDRPLQIDLSNTIGGNHFDFRVKNSNNASLGFKSPTEANAGGFSYTQNVTNLDLSRKFNGQIPVQLRGGTEFRLENYRQRAGEEASWVAGDEVSANGDIKEAGFQMFPGFRPENEISAYRHNLGIYTQMSVKPFKSATWNAGLRYEYYSDFGSHLTWKMGGRYTFNDLLTIRGNINTGFRAPSMPQVHFSSRGFQFIARGNEVVGTEVGHFNNQSSISQQFGIRPLEVETSKNYSLGIVSKTKGGFSFVLDAYAIYIKNRIVITGRLSSDEDPRFADILKPAGFSRAQFFTNAIDTETKGLDANLNYKLNLASVAINFSLAANISNHRLTKGADGNPIIKTSPLLQEFKDVFFNREEVSRIEVAQPANKTIFTTHMKSGKWDAKLVVIRFGEVKYVHPEDGNPERWVVNELTGRTESRDQTFSAKYVTDLSLKYQLSNRLAIDIGGSNIFDVYPDQHQHSANIDNGLFIYSRRVQQFGIRGAFWYSRINFKF